VIPCHRVVRTNGELGGYGGGQNKKKELLISEEVVIVNGKIDLKKFGWKI
jgi:alkylated DNA nucleotide flippase Atl1